VFYNEGWVYFHFEFGPLEIQPEQYEIQILRFNLAKTNFDCFITKKKHLAKDSIYQPTG
jgi:hypothetical protein